MANPQELMPLLIVMMAWKLLFRWSTCVFKWFVGDIDEVVTDMITDTSCDWFRISNL